MQQMRYGMMAFDRGTAGPVNSKSHMLANARRAVAFNNMNPSVAGFARVRNFPGIKFADHLATVGDLTAHLRVKNGIVQNDAALLTDLDDPLDIGPRMIVFVADRKSTRLNSSHGYI